MKYLVESEVVACPLRQRDVDVESCYHCRWFRDLWSGGQHVIVSCEFVARTSRSDADSMTRVSLIEKHATLGNH